MILDTRAHTNSVKKGVVYNVTNFRILETKLLWIDKKFCTIDIFQ